MKSRMRGAINTYRKMYDAIKDWNTPKESGEWDALYGVGYSMSDIFFHWSDKKAIDEERKVYYKVYEDWKRLKNTLEEVLGINENRND